MTSDERRGAPRAPDETAPEVRRARARLAGGNPRSALRVIEEYLARVPGDAPAFFEKSRILYELGDRPASLDARLKALELKKASTDAAVIADMLAEDGLFDEAEALLRVRLDRDDRQNTTRFTLAKLLLFRGRFLEAADEIQALYKVSEPGPLLRADHLDALRFALLGDDESLRRLVDRLAANRVSEVRLAYFRALSDFLSNGDADLFASTMAKIRRGARANAVYFNFYRLITPELFLGAESPARQEFHRVLGDRLRRPRIAGETFEGEELGIIHGLFSAYQSVRFEPINAPDTGLSGDRVYRVSVERKPYRENPCLVKIGPKHRIAIEKEKMESFVTGKLHPNFHPHIIGYAHGLRAAAMRMSWATVDESTPIPLRQLFGDAATAPATLGEILDTLMHRVLHGWHGQNTRLAPARPFRPLERMATLTSTRVAALRDGGDDSGVVTLPGIGEIADPARLLRALLAARGGEKVPVPYGLHHGDLNSRNVILDSAGTICLIDYYKSGPGFVLLDHARLEADLRFESTGEPEEELIAELRWMDRQLARYRSISAVENLDVRRSSARRLAAAVALRRAARDRFGLGEARTAELYSLAMLLTLTRMLRYNHLGPIMTGLILAEISDLAERLLGNA
jgi:hypothetical protein